jgi:RNA polymerase primary sigma factor
MAEEYSEQAHSNDIERYALLADPEEAAVILRMVNGDKEALNTLVQQNMRYVRSMARRFYASVAPITKQRISMLDLMQEGYIALLESSKNYDPKQGFKYLTYMTAAIFRAMRNYCNVHGNALKLPKNGAGYIDAILEARRTLRSQGKKITPEALQEQTDLPITAIKDFLYYLHCAPRSFDEAVFEDNSIADTLRAIRADPLERVEADSNKAYIMAIVDSLDGKMSLIIKMRFGLTGEEPMIRRDIGVLLEISEQRVHQLEKKALEILRTEHGEALRDLLYCSWS